MAILGIESIIYGVEDLALCTQYWDDYGLKPVTRDNEQAVWEVRRADRG